MIRFGTVTIDTKTRTITNGARSRQWMNNCNDSRGRLIMFRMMKHLLLSSGITANELFTLLYGDRADGGPLEGDHIIHIHLAQVKPALDILGMKLKTWRKNSRTVYRVAPASA